MAIHNNKLFFGPKHNIYAFFMMLFGLFDLRVLFVCQICHVNCETIENKRYFWIIKYQVNWLTKFRSLSMTLTSNAVSGP